MELITKSILVTVLAIALIGGLTASAMAATPTPGPTMAPAKATASPSVTTMPGATPGPAANTLAGVLSSDPDLSKFNDAVKNTDLTGTLGGAGPHTIFAPTNAAFDRMPADKAAVMNIDKPTQAFVLKYHVADGKYTTTDLKHTDHLPTVLNRPVPVTHPGSEIMVDGARVLDQGKDVGNTIVYKVDAVMIPPYLTL